MSIFSKWVRACIFSGLLALFFSVAIIAQKPAVVPPKVGSLLTVKLVDEVALKPILVAKGRPLLVNFWATWCGPCREEFPDLVKLDQEFKGKIDFITISLDFPEDIAGAVPDFLASMKAEMPAYLLKTEDESALIEGISKEWHGGMPFTILYDKTGAPLYQREGKVHLDVLRPQIASLISNLKD